MSMDSEKTPPAQQRAETSEPDPEEAAVPFEGFTALEQSFGTGINEKVLLVTKGMTLKKLHEAAKKP